MLKKVFYFSLTFVVLVNIFVLIFNKSEAQNTYCTPVPSLIWGSSTWPGAGRLVMTSSTQGVLIEYFGAPIVTGSGSINKIAFWTGSNTLSSDTNLHWDNVNKRLGIKTTSPSYELDVNGTISANQIIGTYTGTINAANVSAGQFGANTGGGDYYFMGNVGIGTTTPGSKLHVHGSGFPVFISSSAGAGGTPGIEMQDPTAKNYGARVYFDDAAAGGIGGLKLVGLSNGVETLGIFINRDSGNVGIGTTAPGAILDLKGLVQFNPFIGGAGETRFDINPITTDNTKAANIVFFRNTNTNGPVAVFIQNGQAANPVNNIKLGGNGDTWLNAVFGNVGIGTMAPNANNPYRPSLDVAGFIRVNSNHTWDPDTYSRWFILRKARLTSNPYLEIQLEDGNLYGINIWLSKTESKTDITDLEIDSEKIYELRPVSFKLKSSGIRTFGLLAEETYKIIPELVNLDDKGDPLFVSYDLLSVLNTAELKNIRKGLRVDKAGNVGIGTTAPGYKLQVGNAGDGTSAIANAWNVFSDINFKTNISEINNALDIVSQLRGVKFNWKETGKPSLGFIAQEVESILPEIVSTDSNGYKSVDYNRVIPVLVEAIKEQQKIIKKQQKIIKEHQKEIDELKVKLNSLK